MLSTTPRSLQIAARLGVIVTACILLRTIVQKKIELNASIAVRYGCGQIYM